MKNIIVGTAGHVDHGKTCLIKALTGIDTDRLKEEKKRGITIENGFADMLYGGYNISIIDVPGHERFIKNMLTGIGGIDLVLLVIGLDEGIMPQTVEHFQILKMLDIRRGIIVFTKQDLVDDKEWIELVKEDTRELIAGTFLEGAPMLEVSAYTGYNIEELKQLIVDNIDDTILKNDADSLFRLPVDRVFTIDGFGTVVTGTLMEGTIHIGEEVMIYPQGKTAKVRNLQVHNEQTETAFAGQRTAINLAGVKKEELARGCVLARKDSLKPTRMLDVRLELFSDIEWTVLNNSRLHFYCGSAEVLCKVVLLDRDTADAGTVCYAQLRLEEEVAVKKNDRFILRFYSPLVTIGGGKVLEVQPVRHKRNEEQTLKALAVKDNDDVQEVAALLIKENSTALLSLPELATRLRIENAAMEEIAGRLEDAGTIRRIHKEYLVHTDHLKHIKRCAEDILRPYHEKNSVSGGMAKEEFRSRLMQSLRLKDSKLADAYILELTQTGVLRTDEKKAALADFSICLSEEMQATKSRLQALYAERRFEMPTMEEAVQNEKDPTNAGHLIGLLIDEGILVRLNYQYAIDAKALSWALEELRKVVAREGEITLAAFRDIIGTSRKYALEILEYFDREKITKKEGDVRVLTEGSYGI